MEQYGRRSEHPNDVSISPSPSKEGTFVPVQLEDDIPIRPENNKPSHIEEDPRKVHAARRSEWAVIIIFFFIGLCLFSIFLSLSTKQIAQLSHYSQTICNIIETKQESKCTDTNCDFRIAITVNYTNPSSGDDFVGTAYDTFNGEYTAGEKDYLVAQYPEGDQIRCWFNDGDSTNIVLDKRITAANVVLMLVGLCILITVVAPASRRIVQAVRRLRTKGTGTLSDELF
eukprot:TRINITY_DN5081_c0_g1_i1.p1 TRINITY_DN5081_c0_g1~~TRINITY_DN5081_c0_g1_i1.p1  ORF type:complete len:228 (+),score=28.95 TRINITY_DN5081_c0_g1_i1:18-701(+)